MKRIYMILLLSAFITCKKEIAQRPEDITIKAEDTAVNVTPPLSPVLGSEKAKVIILWFGDFECPYCGEMFSVIQRVLTIYGDKVQVVFKHNPLPVHKNSQAAAIASMSAYKQGKFWQYADKLFSGRKMNEVFNNETLEKYARETRLDIVKFRQDMNDPEILKFIELDKRISFALKAQGTPNFFINGRNIVGAKPYEEFTKIIDEEITKVDEVIAKGTPPNSAPLIVASIQNPQYDRYIIKGEEPPPLPSPQQRAKIPETVFKAKVRKDDPFRGNINAPVTIVEFGNYKCPWCRKAEDVMKKLVLMYPQDIRIMFKHSPLPMYPESYLASEASYAAHAQGKFWEYHDLLFENQGLLNRENLEKLAEKAGLDMIKFRNDLDKHTYKEKVEEDKDIALLVTAKGTPNFFINGRKMVGAKSLDEMKLIIEEELQKAKTILQQGVSAGNLYDSIIEKGVFIYPLDDKVVEIPEQNDPIIGEKKAKINLIIFSDFLSPLSQKFVRPMEFLANHYRGNFKLVFKPFPSGGKEDIGRFSTLASYCALDQNKFWQFHNKLFENQQGLTKDKIFEIANALNLNISAFKSCIENKKFDEKIEKEIKFANEIGVRSAPAIFLNGRRYKFSGWFDPEDLVRVIDRFLFKPSVAIP